MRIQHNIMAMNAYRNYNTNTSALSRNLEKLSSGYKINRAGDDAAGLAISEKMRAQITGLNAAQKNVKDGISLVKTAEGAMQEIQDMLNRMDYLATQSANGTYDNEVDRANLQKEVEQLKSEINRIADSSNFNGIKLLDGSLDDTIKETINETTFEDVQPAVRHTKDDYKDIQGQKLQLHKESTGAGKTSFEIDLSNYEVKGETDGLSGKDVTFELSMGKATADNSKPGNYTKPESATDSLTAVAGDTADSGKWTATVTADKNGNISGKDIAAAFVKTLNGDGVAAASKGTIKLNVGGQDIEYTVTADGNKLKFEMTDNGYKTAAAAYDDEQMDNTGTMVSNVFNGDFDIGITATVPGTVTVNYDDATAAAAGTYTKDADGNTAAADTDFTDGAKVYKDGVEYSVAVDNGKVTLTGDGDVPATQWGLTDLSTSNIHTGTAAAGTQLADGFTGYMGARDFQDGSGFTFGDTNYVFAGTNETLNAKFDANTKVIDIRDLFDKETNGLKDEDMVVDALSRLSEAAEGNKMWSIQVSQQGDGTNFGARVRLNYREQVDYNGDGKDGRADLTTTEGVQAQVKFFKGAKANYEVTEAKGKTLQLQIGDTSDAFNQLQVKVGDMHTAALGIADLDISKPESASSAIATIKAAINQVSSVRGDLGATQNRLEHTANNLSVMAENIQDAESTIRDTDVAEEMMAYTKNNILIQSAQAMLAQANAVPQGVLQLLG